LPAIYPARLQNQIIQLAELYGEPAKFTHALTELLELYANRAHRPGQAGEPPPLLRTYNVPKPVIRQLMLELQPLANDYPEETLELIKVLWDSDSLETRQVAASLLGSIPPNAPDAILDIISSWLAPKPEERLISLVLKLALERIRKENPNALFTKIASWLSSDDLIEQQIGLNTLKSLLTSREFENFPQFIQLLIPYTRKAPLQIRADVLETLNALAIRTPKESAYLLRQSLSAPENPDTALLIRKLLPIFPDDLQESLRQALREPRG
jgi:hypothetical protein